MRAPWLRALVVALAVGVGALPGSALGEAPARSGAGHGARGSKGDGTRKPKKPHRAQPKAKPKARRSKSRGVRRLDTEWHRPAAADECEALAGAPPGSWGLMSLGAKRCIVVAPIGEGPIAASEDAAIREAFVDKRRGEQHSVDLRLLRVLERAVRHFEVPYVHLISGFRPGRSASRHAHGLAADVVFPGVTNRDLARFMRQQGFMGVGIYMRTGFVHVDVRERSYFWLDWSPPGKKWRGKPILMDEARAADEAARQRGDSPFEAPEELSAAVEARRAKKARARAARATRQKEAKRRAAARKRAQAAQLASDESSPSGTPLAEAEGQP